MPRKYLTCMHAISWGGTGQETLACKPFIMLTGQPHSVGHKKLLWHAETTYIHVKVHITSQAQTLSHRVMLYRHVSNTTELFTLEFYNCCVTRRKHHRTGIAPNANTTHVPTAGSSAAPTKPNHTLSRHSRAKGKLLLQTVTPHAAGSRRTHVSRTQECARTRPVTRRATTIRTIQLSCTDIVGTGAYRCRPV